MKSKYCMLSLSALAAGCYLFSTCGTAWAQGQEMMTTTTKTQGPPQVLKSYMVPTLMQTKETTTADGDTIKETAPMIQERHEQVLVPEQETTTQTMLMRQPRVIEDRELHTSQFRHVKATTCAPKRHVAYRPRHSQKIASNYNYNYKASRRIVEEPVVHTKETVIDKSMVFERRDPSLDNQ